MFAHQSPQNGGRRQQLLIVILWPQQVHGHTCTFTHTGTSSTHKHKIIKIKIKDWCFLGHVPHDVRDRNIWTIGLTGDLHLTVGELTPLRILEPPHLYLQTLWLMCTELYSVDYRSTSFYKQTYAYIHITGNDLCPLVDTKRYPASSSSTSQWPWRRSRQEGALLRWEGRVCAPIQHRSSCSNTQSAGASSEEYASTLKVNAVICLLSSEGRFEGLIFHWKKQVSERPTGIKVTQGRNPVPGSLHLYQDAASWQSKTVPRLVNPGFHRMHCWNWSPNPEPMSSQNSKATSGNWALS